METKSKILSYRMKDMRDRIIKIRSYTDSDYRDLKEMYDNFEPKGLEAGLPPPNKETRHKWIDQMLSSFFNVLVLHRDRVVGHAALDISDVHGCPEYLIFIKDGFRYCGIGTKISKIVKEMARNAGCRKVWVSVRSGNFIAIRVFKKYGFEFVGEIDIQREMELIIKKSSKKSTA